MSRLQRLVCVTILASPLWAQEARRLALVIGISAYNDQIGQLSKPLDDAQSIRTALEQDGFAVTPLLDATRIELLQGLMSFASSIRRGDIVFVYYAGHGVQVDGANFILPRDFSGSSADLKTKAVRLDEIIQSLNESGPKLKILVFDACRDNPFGTRQRGLAEMQAAAYGAGTYIAMSAAPNQPAFDGLFARHLVTALGSPGLSVGAMFIQVRNGVLKESGNRQNPFSTDLQLEEFYFLPHGATAPSAQPVSTSSGTANVTRKGEAAQSERHTFFGYANPESAACVEVMYSPSEFPQEATNALKAYLALYLNATDRSLTECSALGSLQLRTTVHDVGNGCIEVDMDYRLTPVRQSGSQAKTGMAAGRRECYGANAERTEKSATESAFASLRDVLTR
jgi:hypothetical protein